MRVSACRVVGSEKPVFGAEYCDATAAGNGVTQDPGCYCPDALAAGRNVLIKTTDLNDKVRANASFHDVRATMKDLAATVLTSVRPRLHGQCSGCTHPLDCCSNQPHTCDAAGHLLRGLLRSQRLPGPRRPQELQGRQGQRLQGGIRQAPGCRTHHCGRHRDGLRGAIRRRRTADNIVVQALAAIMRLRDAGRHSSARLRCVRHAPACYGWPTYPTLQRLGARKFG
jgi:hypothetical protein